MLASDCSRTPTGAAGEDRRDQNRNALATLLRIFLPLAFDGDEVDAAVGAAGCIARLFGHLFGVGLAE
jgi:hypothetical protein